MTQAREISEITGNPSLGSVLSPDGLRRLSAAFGGEILYVPSPQGHYCDTRERLEALLGEEAHPFFATYSTQTIPVPRLPNLSRDGRANLKARAASVLKNSGFSLGDIARVMGQSLSTVSAWLSVTAE